MTRKQLEKFIKLRNASGFASNLQFQIDVEKCGIDIREFREIQNIPNRPSHTWEWNTPFGILREEAGKLFMV